MNHVNCKHGLETDIAKTHITSNKDRMLLKYQCVHYGPWLAMLKNQMVYIWLVVSNMTVIFHSIWDPILPIDFHIFQRG